MLKLSLENPEILKTPKGNRFVFRFDRELLGYWAAGPIHGSGDDLSEDGSTKVYSHVTKREEARVEILEELVAKGF